MSTVFRKYNEGNGQWEAILVGVQGPQGQDGINGVGGAQGPTGPQGAAGIIPLTGTTTNGVLTYDGDGTGTVESGLTYNGSTLTVSGAITATGDVTASFSSDARLKENKEKISNPIDKINQIGGYEFDWKTNLVQHKPTHDVGVIAQEIEKVLPEIVVTREDGYLAVRYEKIAPLLIEGIKELSQEVERLKNILDKNGITE